MEFKLDAKMFNNAVRTVRPGAANNSTLPVLSNVALRYTQGVLQLVTTNLEFGVSIRIPLDAGETAWGTTVSAAKLMDVVSAVTSGDLSLTIESSAMTLKGDGMKVTLNVIDIEEFPPTPTTESKVEMSVVELKGMIEKVLFSAANDDSRPTLGGVHVFGKEGGLLALETTDGIRATRQYSSEIPGLPEINMIVPAAGLKVLSKVLAAAKSGQDTVLIGSSDGVVAFTVGDVTVTSSLLEGNYPDIERIIPLSYSKEVDVKTSDLARAIKLANIFSKNGGSSVSLLLNDGQITVKGNSEELGCSTTEIPVAYEGDNFEITCNGAFLMDMVSVVSADTARLRMNMPNTPLSVLDADNSAAVYILMPTHKTN